MPIWILLIPNNIFSQKIFIDQAWNLNKSVYVQSKSDIILKGKGEKGAFHSKTAIEDELVGIYMNNWMKDPLEVKKIMFDDLKELYYASKQNRYEVKYDSVHYRIVQLENYTIHNFWKLGDTTNTVTEDGIIKPRFINHVISNFCDSAPRAIISPAALIVVPSIKIFEQVELHLDANFTYKTNSIDESNSVFTFRQNVVWAGSSIRVYWNFETHKTTSTIDEYNDMISKLRGIQNVAKEYSVTYKKEITENKKRGTFNWPMIILFLSAIVAFTIIYLFVIKRKKSLNENDIAVPSEVGGWLGVLSATLLFKLFLSLYQFFNKGYFKLHTWQIYTTTGENHYHPLWKYIIVTDVLLLSFSIVCSIVLVSLIHTFQKRTIKYYVFFCIINLLVQLLMFIGSVFIYGYNSTESEEVYYSFYFAYGWWGCWLAYLIHSKRVKETFIL